MLRRLLHAICFALPLLAAVPGTVCAQDAIASQFPQLPLKREPAAQDSVSAAWGWSALLLLAVAGVLVALKRRSPLTVRSAQGAPKPVGSASLTPHATLHVVEWRGEQLLLACTPHAVTVVSRHELTADTESPKGTAA
ncbi:hypothetical protein GCM10027034_24970 [Ramlibacter solisilvae]|uniref:Candidate membrane protein n=1 Tax=Ramlibacter tataouinensis TaxID=94132 RepID=A0A127JQD7_9BURK|nr:flagellar biosynthetic protein FliO [Ramlibacter tataouinensis]AMO22190.1 hypothetical protein UC35_03910 [Ramlibacter tataouinensis]